MRNFGYVRMEHDSIINIWYFGKDEYFWLQHTIER